MLDMSWGEVMLIGGVALIVIGPKDLPKALRTVGQVTTKLRRMAGEFQMQFNEAIREAELDDVRREVDGIRNTVRSASGGFNPVQTIRDELKGAVEGRAAKVGPEKPGPETYGPERPAQAISEREPDAQAAIGQPVPEPAARSLADATAQLKAERQAADLHTPETVPERMADVPLPVPGSVEDPFGPPAEPPPAHATPADTKNGAAGR